MRVTSAFILAFTFTAVVATPQTTRDSRFTISKRMADFDQYEFSPGLYHLTDQLMSMVQYLSFSFDRFKHLADELSIQLSQIDLAIKQLYPLRESLLNRLKFTQKVFHEMSQAVQYRSLFPISEGVDYHIAMNIVQVNLNLLKFFDDAGKPSPELPVWDERDRRALDFTKVYPAYGYISAFKHRYEEMRLTFGKNGPVDVPLRLFFEQQVQKATDTFNLLYAAIPEETS